MSKQKLLGQIMGIAYLLNENSDFTVFTEFSGHVNQISIRLKDEECLNYLAESHIYLDKPDTEARLIEVGAQLSNILTTGEIDYSRLHKGKYGSREAFFFCVDKQAAH